jgi:hypothetical protein
MYIPMGQVGGDLFINAELDFLGLNNCLYEWADSYDSKDWARLEKCIAPTLRVHPPFPESWIPN